MNIPKIYRSCLSCEHKSYRPSIDCAHEEDCNSVDMDKWEPNHCTALIINYAYSQGEISGMKQAQEISNKLFSPAECPANCLGTNFPLPDDLKEPGEIIPETDLPG